MQTMKKKTCQSTKLFSLHKIGLVLTIALFGFSHLTHAQEKSSSRSIDTTLKVSQKKSIDNPVTETGKEYPVVVMKKAGENQVTNPNGYYSKKIANSSKLDVFMAEVNRDCPQYNGGTYRETALDCLNRTIYHKIPVGEYPECPLLSTAMKKNKCNPDMVYNYSFDPDSFNPLKYHFMYFSPNTSFYRVDGTEYIIEIVPPKK
jgi:hypothetical protein